MNHDLSYEAPRRSTLRFPIDLNLNQVIRVVNVAVLWRVSTTTRLIGACLVVWRKLFELRPVGIDPYGEKNPDMDAIWLV